MATLRYSASAPNGWLLNESNGLVKVDQATYDAAKAGGTVAQQAAAPAAPASGTGGNVTLYRGSDTMTVPAGDVGYWTDPSNGWSTSRPATAAAPQAPASSYSPAPTEKVNVYMRNSDGSYSTMPVLGSDVAYWRSQGWLDQTQVPNNIYSPVSPTAQAAPVPGQQSVQTGWSAVLKNGTVYIVIANGQVISSFDNETAATERAQQLGSYQGSYSDTGGYQNALDVQNYLQRTKPELFGKSPSGTAVTPEGAATTEKPTEQKAGDTVQVKNGKTGQVLTIPADQVPFMSDQWALVGGESVEDAAKEREYPKELTDIDGFNDLTDEQKTLALYTWSKVMGETETARKDAEIALEQAKQQSDPYHKSLITFAQDELSRAIGTTQADLSDQMADMAAKKKQIDQDLAFNRDQLSIEEQADMARLSREYDQNLRTLQTNAQEAGLVFSSPREQAERELVTARTDVGESTARKYQRNQRELQLSAERGLEEIARGEQTTQRQAQEQATSYARQTEARVGSENLPSDLGGVAVPKLGGMVGDLQNQRDMDLLKLQADLMAKMKPQSISTY